MLPWLAAIPPARADEEFDALVQEFEAQQDQWFERLRRQSEAEKASEAPKPLPVVPAGEKQAEAGDKPADAEAATEAKRADARPAVEPEPLPPHPAEKFLPRFRAYAEKHAGRTEAIAALAWIVRNSRFPSSSETESSDKPLEWAITRLRKDHAAQEEIRDALKGTRYLNVDDPALVTDLLEAVIKSNPDAEAKAIATYNLAAMLFEGRTVRDRDDDEKRAADKKRGEELFRRAAEEYKDTKAGQAAAGYLFEIANLQVGMKAPDIAGTGPYGNPIKLSDFRGGVVVVYFWGFW
jgi:hypothetical protein